MKFTLAGPLRDTVSSAMLDEQGCKLIAAYDSLTEAAKARVLKRDGKVIAFSSVKGNASKDLCIKLDGSDDTTGETIEGWVSGFWNWTSGLSTGLVGGDPQEIIAGEAGPEQFWEGPPGYFVHMDKSEAIKSAKQHTDNSRVRVTHVKVHKLFIKKDQSLFGHEHVARYIRRCRRKQGDEASNKSQAESLDWLEKAAEKQLYASTAAIEVVKVIAVPATESGHKTLERAL